MLFHWPVSNCFSEHTSRSSHTTQPRCAFGCTSRTILNTTDICLTAAHGQMRAEFMRTRGSRALPTWAACRKRPAAQPGELVCGRLKQVAFQSIVDGQLKPFQACMQACMETNNKRFDDFVRGTIGEISELKVSLQFTQKELQEVKQSVKVNNDGNTAADKLLAKLTDDIKRVDDAADYMENQSRRNNLRVDGVKEKPGETWQERETETALRQVVQRELKLPADQVGALQIERAQRTGAPTTTQCERTIVVKFASFKDRDTIIRAARSVKPKGFFFNVDFSQRVISRRKELLPDMREQVIIFSNPWWCAY